MSQKDPVVQKRTYFLPVTQIKINIPLTEVNCSAKIKSYAKLTFQDFRTVEDVFKVQALQVFLSEQKYFYNSQKENGL